MEYLPWALCGVQILVLVSFIDSDLISGYQRSTEGISKCGACDAVSNRVVLRFLVLVDSKLRQLMSNIPIQSVVLRFMKGTPAEPKCGEF